MVTVDLLSCSDHELCRIVSWAFAHCRSPAALADSPLAASALCAAAAVSAAVPLARQDIGRAVRAVLQWTVDRIAPGSVRYPFHTRRPGDDPAWIQPAWAFYNILRHRYLEPLPRIQAGEGCGPVEQLLRQMGIQSKKRFFALRREALREAAEIIRHALRGQIQWNDLPEIAMAEYMSPLRRRPECRRLLNIAALFSSFTPVELLKNLAQAERIAEPDRLLGVLAGLRLVETRADDREFRTSVRLAQHVEASVDLANARRWHAMAAEYFAERRNAVDGCRHLFAAGKFREFYDLLRSALPNADSAAFRRLAALAERLPVEGLPENERASLYLFRRTAGQLVYQQSRTQTGAPDLVLLAKDPALHTEGHLRLASQHEPQSGALASVFYGKAAAVAPAGSPLRAVSLLRHAALLNGMRDASRAESLTMEAERAGLPADPWFRAMADMNLAQASRIQGKLDAAREFAERTVAGWQISGHLARAALCRAMLSEILLAAGAVQLATEEARAALARCRELDAGEGIVRSLTALGAALLQLGAAADAKAAANEALPLGEASGQLPWKFSVRLLLARIHAADGQPRTADSHLTAAVEIARKWGAPLLAAGARGAVPPGTSAIPRSPAGHAQPEFRP